MRESRKSGSEGGAAQINAPSLPLSDGSIVSSYTYANDLLGRRETISQGGEAFGLLKLGANTVEVAYNDRSEVVGAAYRSGGEVRQRFGYDYDAIGNRRSFASEVGSRKSEVSYVANALNQYATIDERSPSNPQSALRNPQFDPDGNLLEDARNTYTWNADNNLVRVESKEGTSRIEYVYDHQSRRTVRRTHTRAAATEKWTLKSENFYLYDDWNLVADVSAVTGDGSRVTGEEAYAVRYYTWGRDLIGSLQGAGGVGGLLAISSPESAVDGSRSAENSRLKTENSNTVYPCYDANGNIGQLINGAGAVVAAYAYDPFGNVTEMAGAEASENPWRFSTKPVEAGTGWLYYGYRLYDAGMGRWVNRDPIDEEGGVNLFAFVRNDGVGGIDHLGRIPYFLRVSHRKDVPCLPTGVHTAVSLAKKCNNVCQQLGSPWGTCAMEIEKFLVIDFDRPFGSKITTLITGNRYCICCKPSGTPPSIGPFRMEFDTDTPGWDFLPEGPMPPDTIPR